MKQMTWVLAGAVILSACGGSKEARIAADSASRDIQLAVVDSAAPLVNDAAPARTDPPAPAPAAPRRRATAPSPSPAPAPPAAPTPEPAPVPAPAPPPRAPARLEPGTVIEAAATRALTSRSNKAGETFTATIGNAVTAEDGRVVIPAGAEVSLIIVALKPAPNKSAKDGTIIFQATNIVVNGESRAIDAEVTFVEHTLKGRGVTGSEAAKVGIGAAAGAIVGRVIGGGTGTAVGAVAGGAAGAAVAVESANRDVVVAVGAKITLTLRSALAAGS